MTVEGDFSYGISCTLLVCMILKLETPNAHIVCIKYEDCFNIDILVSMSFTNSLVMSITYS